MREDGSEERIGEGRRSPTSLPGVTMVSEASRAGRPTAAAGRDGGGGGQGHREGGEAAGQKGRLLGWAGLPCKLPEGAMGGEVSHGLTAA